MKRLLAALLISTILVLSAPVVVQAQRMVPANTVVRNEHLHAQAAGWMKTTYHFIQVGYYHPAYDMAGAPGGGPDGKLDVCDLQWFLLLWLYTSGRY